MDYADKRSFDQTPEPPPAVEGDVDPLTAPAGGTFVIHQHHARRLHFDLRLEMRNGKFPVLVSWAVPKNLPLEKGRRALAVHVEDHPFEYGRFSGTIPAGNYGAGEVRIFDSGNYEMVKREPGKLTFRLNGRRLKGIWHLVRTRQADGKDDWLAIFSKWEGGEAEAAPPATPMLAIEGESAFDDPEWTFEPIWQGKRTIAICKTNTRLFGDEGEQAIPERTKLEKIHEHLVALDAIVDGVTLENQSPPTFVAFDLLYMDGKSLTRLPYDNRRELLEKAIVPAEFLQVSPSVRNKGKALMAAVTSQGLHGIVAKMRSSIYEPGIRSGSWLRIKN